MNKRKQKILIYDLETATNGKINADEDSLRVFGSYSYLTGKQHTLIGKKDMKAALNMHDVFVGFNNLQYDNKVLANNGFLSNVNIGNNGKCYLKKKINIDLREVIIKRAASMKVKQGKVDDILLRFDLDYVAQKLLNIKEEDSKIKDFDYSVLRKTPDQWTPEEKRKIKEYTERDIEVTKQLFEFVSDYFESFKDFLHQKDVDQWKHLTTSISVFAYKAICKMLTWQELYNQDGKEIDYGGGYVAYPSDGHVQGDIICFDFNSLYPMIFLMCNLFSKTTSDDGWTGGGKFHVEGKYNTKKRGKIENMLLKLYEKRLKYKAEGDPREYTIKILINTFYGLTGNSTFQNLFDPVAAADCTRLGRQFTKLVRQRLREAGFKNIYSDTDSVYVLNHHETRDEIYKVIKAVVKEILDHVPFPCEYFDMGIDDEITDIWFFHGKNQTEKESDKEMDEDDFINKPKGFMKKNYIYRAKKFDKDGNFVDYKMVVKNLGVNRKNISQLSRHIFWKILLQKIKDERQVAFPRTYFHNLIYKLLEDDVSLAATRYKVTAPHTYANTTSIQAQISKMYGEGIHFLIPNKKKMGAGKNKNKRYCTIEEYKNHNMTVSDINFDTIWSELGYFIKKEKPITLENFFGEA